MEFWRFDEDLVEDRCGQYIYYIYTWRERDPI